MPTALVVRHPFGKYTKGQVITDADTVAAIEKTAASRRNVSRIEVRPPVAEVQPAKPAAVEKNDLQVLEPFGTYKLGEIITDQAAIKTILAGPDAGRVRRVVVTGA
jgi:hypothetical protein